MLLRLQRYNLNVKCKPGSQCDPPQEFDAKGESTLTTRLHETLSVP